MSKRQVTQFKPNLPHPVADPVPQYGGRLVERGGRKWTRTVKVHKYNSGGRHSEPRYSQPARSRVVPREWRGWIRGARRRKHPGRLLPRYYSGWPSRNAISWMLGTSGNVDPDEYSHAWPKVSGVLHSGYDAVPSVPIRRYPAGTRWSRRDCGDPPVAFVKVQSGCVGESCGHPRRVARSGRRKRWCLRRATALLSRTM
jgi:hypothetical protein